MEANDNDEVTELAKKITAEVKENSPKSVKTYNLGDFKLEKVKESTNESLLYLISKLVSYCKREAKEHCANVHTKKTEHAVETDEEEELDEPLAEEESEDEG